MDNSSITMVNKYKPMSKQDILAILFSSNVVGKEDLSEKAYEMILNMPRPEKNSKLHDTSLLLKQYRNIRYAVSANIYALAGTPVQTGQNASEYQHILDVLIETLGTEIEFEIQRNSNSRKERQAKSIVYCLEYLKIVENALDILRKKPNKGELYYNILYYTFIDEGISSYNDKQCGFEAVKSKLNEKGYYMGQTTYYRQKSAAIEAISPILWGFISKDMFKIVLSFGVNFL